MRLKTYTRGIPSLRPAVFKATVSSRPQILKDIGTKLHRLLRVGSYYAVYIRPHFTSMIAYRFVPTILSEWWQRWRFEKRTIVKVLRFYAKEYQQDLAARIAVIDVELAERTIKELQQERQELESRLRG